MTDPKLIEALSGASSLELYELSAIIDRLLADPRRIIAVRNKLNLGQTVRFMDARTGQMRPGKIVAIKDAQVVVQDDGTRQQSKLPYAAIEPGAGAKGIGGHRRASSHHQRATLAPPFAARGLSHRRQGVVHRPLPAATGGHHHTHQPAYGVGGLRRVVDV